MRVSRAMLVLLLSISGAGCITLNERSISHDFGGLRAAMGRSRTVCMLIVHGMGGYSTGDPDALIASIQTQLHLRATGQALPTTVPDDIDQNVGTLVRRDMVDPSGRELRIYTLQWEPLTAPLKREYLQYDAEPQATRPRLPIHNDLKQSLMNENVPDVVMYVGDYKPVLQQTVKSALRRMEHDLGGSEDYEFFFVTFSLGSKIVFDVVDEMDNEAERDNSNAIVDKTASFFMLANQIPLLGLGEARPLTTTRPFASTESRGYQSMLRFVRRKRGGRGVRPQKVPTSQSQSNELSIVAVSDPNDLFSYTIPPYVQDQFPATLVNVVISVAQTGYLIPSHGYVANPLEAHTGYGHDPDVIKLLIDGGKAGK